MTENLRSLLELVAKKCPENLVEINETMDLPHREIAAYLKLMEDRGRLPVTMFR